MANEGTLPDFDLKMPPMNLDLPAPGLSLELPDLKLDAPLDVPPSAPALARAEKAEKPSGKPSGEKGKPSKTPKKPKAKAKIAAPGLPGAPEGARLPLVLNALNILILLVIAAIMYLFELPVNAVPDLTLTTYVQSIWLTIGCFFVMAMLHDVRTALVLTGVDLAMVATIFPTLWLLLEAPMNPMYFFVLGQIALLAIVALPLGAAKSRKEAAKKAAPAGAGALVPAAASTGPRTTS